MQRDIRKVPGGRLSGELLQRWQGDEIPDVFELARRYPPANARELADALVLDLTESWKHGKPRPVAAYFSHLPDLLEDPQLRIELIQCAYRLQCEYSHPLDVDSFVMQFPDLQHLLKGVLTETIAMPLADDRATETPMLFPVRTPRIWRSSQDVSVAKSMPGRLGRYLIHGELGSGQYGTVYRAFDDRLQRFIAIKVPKRAGLSDNELKAFQAEARNLAKLEHPHIVSVYDFGITDDGGCFVVEQFIDGCSLSEAIQERQFSHEETAILLAMAADALQEAHINQIVHRDIKPANILLDSEYRPYVADFGLSITEEQRNRGEYSIAGTPAYMSPEQVAGDTQFLDGRADIWAVGIVLYEMLTGSRPFRGSVQQVLHQIPRMEPKRLRVRNPTVPAELERICLKCLQKSRQERYSTARDLAADLRCFLSLAGPRSDSFHLISATTMEEQPFPVIGCTMVNRTDKAVVIIAMRVEILEFRPFRTPGTTRELAPITRVDINLSTSIGLTEQRLATPVLITSQDAATVAVRCACRDEISGVSRSPAELGGFRFRLTFVTDTQIEAVSDELKIGRI